MKKWKNDFFIYKFILLHIFILKKMNSKDNQKEHSQQNQTNFTFMRLNLSYENIFHWDGTCFLVDSNKIKMGYTPHEWIILG